VIGLGIVLLAVLAFELPHLLKGGKSSRTTSAVPTTANPTIANPTSQPAVAPGAAAAATPAAKPAAALAFRQLPARDPFTPDAVATAGETAAPAAVKPLPGRDPFRPLLGETTQAPAAAKPVEPVPVAKPVVTQPARPGKTVTKTVFAPTAAVIWTNGHPRVIGLLQLFKLGDTSFRLVGLTADTAKIRVVVAGFKGKTQAITIQRNDDTTLTNVGTGVRYTLRLVRATSAKTASRGQ
jgi:hypothetical protein